MKYHIEFGMLFYAFKPDLGKEGRMFVIFLETYIFFRWLMAYTKDLLVSVVMGINGR